ASTDRNKVYMRQPNGWTCGPTSLTMCLSAWGVRPTSVGTVNEMVGLTHTNPNDGVPDHDQIPNAARKLGMQATYHDSSNAGQVRDALKAGHTVIYNGSLGTGGHFIYVAGLNSDGSFIIFDPARSGTTSMNDAQLNGFGHTNGHSGGFTEIWK
ncbi:MAG: Peptidase like family, partial [Cyanobacteria bacterium RYN_339]|nr:Peptidase like family [Cyanobacteria bacterium RYN_339]